VPTDIVNVAAGVVVRYCRVAWNNGRTDDPGRRIQRVVVQTDSIIAATGLCLISATRDVARRGCELGAGRRQRIRAIALSCILLHVRISVQWQRFQRRWAFRLPFRIVHNFRLGKSLRTDHLSLWHC
jgi:hypothetical protein